MRVQQYVQGWVLNTWENLFIAKKKQNSRLNSEMPVGTVICPFEQWIARWNSNLPVGTVPATVPLQCSLKEKILVTCT